MAREKLKITSEILEELDFELEKRKTVTIETIKGKAEVEIDVYFSETKINKIINDLTDLISPLLASENIATDDLLNPITLLPVLALREFTDLPIPSENDTALISAVNESLVKTGIARQVFEKFNQYELNKMYKLVSIGFKNQPRFLRAYQEVASKYSLQQMTKEEVEADGALQKPE